MQPGWIAADWPAPDGVVAGCTTRQGGHSNGDYSSQNLGGHVGDRAESVARNRTALSDFLQLPGEPCWLEQVHGAAVVTAGRSDTPKADASVAVDNQVSVVMTADCLPVLLCSLDSDCVAAAHGGWRGLAAGILFRTVAEMPAKPQRLIAWLGPAISQNAFEVGSEVRQAFVDQYADAARCFRKNEAGRWQADLYGIARLQLAMAGVSAVFGGDFCTATDEERFFSYRRDGNCGRMASLICLKSR